MKKIILTGATGAIGKKLVKALLDRKDLVTIFTRYPAKAKSIFPTAIKIVEWDYHKPERWKYYLENCDAFVQLAGINLFAKRWNEKFKKKFLESREVSTKNIVDVIGNSHNKPSVLISASGIGYYGDCGNNILTEESSVGKDFLAGVCKIWESEAAKVEAYGVRSVQVRTGLVLSSDAGALKKMLPPFKYFVGGPLGNGKQWNSWLHIDDIVGIYIHAIDCHELTGTVNAASPNPILMKNFARTLGRVLNRPSLITVPKFMLRIIVGESVEAITASQRIDVKKLLKSGYKFKFNELEKALNNLLKT